MINYFCCFFRRQCEKSQDWQRFPTLCRSLNTVVAWRFICCRFWALFTYVSGPHRRQLQVVAPHCGSSLTYWQKWKDFLAWPLFEFCQLLHDKFSKNIIKIRELHSTKSPWTWPRGWVAFALYSIYSIYVYDIYRYVLANCCVKLFARANWRSLNLGVVCCLCSKNVLNAAKEERRPKHTQ